MSDSMGIDRPLQILVVCRANVCRSPFAAEVLRRHLRTASLPTVSVLSAGIQAGHESGLCSLAAAELRTGNSQPSGVDDHAPVAVTREIVMSSALVLTMGESHRSIVVGIDAEVRNRTFTLMEARLFAQAAAAAGAAASSPPEWPGVLNGMRGRVELPTRGARRHRPSGIGIEDGHSSSNRIHRRTLATVERESTALAEALIKLCVAR